MHIETHTLVWLFPIAFMLHDFEEIIFWEVWMNRNGAEIKRRLPAFLAKQVEGIVGKSTAQASFSIFLIFCFTILSSFLAVTYASYGFFLLTSGLFFVHGFMHLAQALFLQKYVPAVISSAVIVIPYGFILFGRLLGEGIVSLSGLLIYCLLGALLMIPFILFMHKAGDYLFAMMNKLLIR